MNCPYLAGCHPHHHAWIHPAHGHGFGLGVLLFIVLVAAIWDLKTRGGQ